MSLRRRSSYSLFPACAPLPSPSQTHAPSGGVVNTSNSSIVELRRIPSRSNSSASEGEAIAAAAAATTASAAAAAAADRVTRPDARETRRHSHTPESRRSSTDLTILRVIKKLKQQSTSMSRLIPLKLESVAVTARMSSPAPTTALSRPNISTPSTSPIYPPERPTIPSRSSSLRKERPGPVTDLTILPYTQYEWRIVMEEVKHLYAKGQYKHCAMRCKQLLEGIKEPHRSHPLYAIYLSFFAASAIEITASSLNNHSSTKLPLYQEALSLYLKAESCIEYASFTADPNIISPYSSNHPYKQGGYSSYSAFHHSSTSSMSSANSVRSSVDTIFTHHSSSTYSVASSTFASPIDQGSELYHRRSSSLSSRSSVESVRPGSGLSQHQRPKKKVSFSLSTHLPTLSSENDSQTTSIDASLIDSFPNPPSQSPSRSPSPTSVLVEAPPISIPLHNQAVARYRLHLSDLSVQLTYHITSIHASIALLSATVNARCSSGPDLMSLLEEENSIPGPGIARFGTTEFDPRKVDIKKRIQRLKESGWSRKRFDGTRYQNLCEKALDEVAESEMF